MKFERKRSMRDKIETMPVNVLKLIKKDSMYDEMRKFAEGYSSSEDSLSSEEEKTDI